MTIRTVAGDQSFDVYGASISAGGTVLVAPEQGVIGDSLPGSVQVLVGRDALQNLAFAYDGRLGTWSLEAYEGAVQPGVSPWLFWGSVAALAAGGALLAYGVGRREYRLGRERALREIGRRAA